MVIVSGEIFFSNKFSTFRKHIIPNILTAAFNYFKGVLLVDHCLRVIQILCITIISYKACSVFWKCLHYNLFLFENIKYQSLLERYIHSSENLCMTTISGPWQLRSAVLKLVLRWDFVSAVRKFLIICHFLRSAFILHLGQVINAA